MIEGIGGVRIGMHVCRGNWSRKEEVLLTGDYERLLPALTKIEAQQFVLEYATPRAGDVHVVGKALSDREIGLGVVNPRTAECEMKVITCPLSSDAPRATMILPCCSSSTS